MKYITELPQHPTYPFAIFKVGDGVTHNLYTDSHAATVIAVSKNGKTVTIQRDNAELDKGKFQPAVVRGGFVGHTTNNEAQHGCYSYSRDPNGSISTYSIRLWRGRYVWTSKGSTPNGRQQISAGRHEFYDYNF
jgi:hypothetical protein